jgi:hypothetical protein
MVTENETDFPPCEDVMDSVDPDHDEVTVEGLGG